MGSEKIGAIKERIKLKKSLPTKNSSDGGSDGGSTTTVLSLILIGALALYFWGKRK